MSTDYKFEGWLGKDEKSAEGKMEWGAFEPKPFEETDVDIQVQACGICGSDLHTLRSGWFPTPYPCVVGHEIIGKAVRVGSKVEKGIKVGDIVGVGAQAGSCLGKRPDCWECDAGLENHCTGNLVNTFGSFWDREKGWKSYGGYADYHRAHSHFTFKIPDAMTSDVALYAPALCAGITAYSPLANNSCGPGKSVGIVGVGGLGHFGILFAKALGADKVVGISRKNNKKDDALKLGADAYIATDDDKDWAKTNAMSLDLIVCTVSSPKMPLAEYMGLLKTNGTFIQVGAPEDHLPEINAFALIGRGVKLGGSAIGPPAQIEEMLKFMVEKNIKPWVNKYPMKDANKAILDFEEGKPRYRFSLVNEKHL